MRIRIRDPERVFSSATSGYSMRIFLTKMEDYDASLVIMKTKIHVRPPSTFDLATRQLSEGAQVHSAPAHFSFRPSASS